MASVSSGLSMRTLCNLIKTTPRNLLPQTTPCLLSALNNCGPILSKAVESQGGNKNSTDLGVLAHKYTAQLTSLLHDKSFEARWAAVILIKTTVELGGWEILRNREPWVRGLLSLLGKRDPPTTHGLAVVTLTKIYLLVQPYQTLRREITSPTLPSFINSCLALINSGLSNAAGKVDFSNPLLPTILDAFCNLVPHHPTIYRPYIAQLDSLINPLLAPTPSSTATEAGGANASSKCTAAAQRLKTLLPCCAPKNTAGEAWAKGLKDNISEIHQTADQIFRAIIEDWEPISKQAVSAADPSTFGNTVGDAGQTTMVLPKWTGIHAGVERLVGLLELLSQYIAIKTPTIVSVSLGPIMDMLTRIFSLIVPSGQGSTNWHEAARLNPQIGKEEREGLFARLPQIHVQGMKLLLVLTERLKESFSPMIQGCLDQIRWVFIAESYDADLRTATYTILAKYLDIAGSSLPKVSALPLSRIIKSCCYDLLPPTQPRSETLSANSNPKRSKKKNGNLNHATVNADSFLGSSTPASLSKNMMLNPGLREAAENFLTSSLYNIPSQHLPLSLRSIVDRTVILTQLKAAMVASVLNPPASTGSGKTRSSIMPHLARSYSGHMEVEGLLRPRMPIIPTGKGLLSGNYEDDEDEMLEDIDDQGEGGGPTSAIGLVENNKDKAEMLFGFEENFSKDRAFLHAGQATQPPVSALTDQAFEQLESTALTLKRTMGEEDREESEKPLPSSNKQIDSDSPPSPKRSRIESATPKTTTPVALELDSLPLSAKVRGISWELPSQVSRSSSQPAHAIDSAAVHGSAVTPGTGDDDDSDNDFEIPEIVMDADTDDEDT